MFNPFQKFFNKPETRRLLENFFSLSALQGSIYLLNFITFPYLVRVLGPEKFGLVIFAQVFTQYFTLITDYGFNLSATREISVNRNNIHKVSQIVSSVYAIKLIFMFLTFCFLLVVLFSIERFRSEYLLYFFAFGLVVGNVLFPVWFFQGMERMKYITVLNLTAKLIFTLSIFLFIKEPSHYVYVLLINSLGFLCAGFISIRILFSQFGIQYKIPLPSDLIYHLKQGWYIFISTLGINIYKSSDIFILGLFANELLVGYYSIAKKIIDFANLFAVIISQTIYPRISKIIRESYKNTISFLQKILVLIFFVTFFLGVIFFLFPALWVKIVAGNFYMESILTLKLLAFVPLIIGLNVPAVQLLLSANLDKEFARIVTFGALLMIMLNFILIPIMSFKGAAIAFLISEFVVTFGLYFFLKLNLSKIKMTSKYHGSQKDSLFP
jgi:PST family polysaccharide transporter